MRLLRTHTHTHTQAFSRTHAHAHAALDMRQADKPFLGICLGLQLLFEGSEESGGHEGLGLVPGTVDHFDTTMGLPVPHIGWNDLQVGGWSAGWTCLLPPGRVLYGHLF